MALFSHFSAGQTLEQTFFIFLFFVKKSFISAATAANVVSLFICIEIIHSDWLKTV